MITSLNIQVSMNKYLQIVFISVIQINVNVIQCYSLT